jgi:Tol biopolymer transport system component
MSAIRSLGHLCALTVIVPMLINVAASAAGTKIVFVSDRDGPAKIYVMSIDGTVTGPIGSLPGFPQHPAFSPDNRQIVFSYSAPGATDDQTYVMNIDGSGARALTTGPNSNSFQQFTKAGRIVYSHELHPHSTTPPFAAPFIMDLDGSHQTPLFSNNVPDYIQDGPISADGIVAFASKNIAGDQRESEQIYTAALDGSSLRRLTNSPDALFAPAWSPDGRKLAYVNRGVSPDFPSNVAPVHERDGIYIMNADGSAVRRIAKIDFGQDLGAAQNLIGIGPSRKTVNLCGSLSFSPDGAMITFSVDIGEKCQIYIVNQDGSHLARLTDLTSANRNPSFNR